MEEVGEVELLRVELEALETQLQEKSVEVYRLTKKTQEKDEEIKARTDEVSGLKEKLNKYGTVMKKKMKDSEIKDQQIVSLTEELSRLNEQISNLSSSDNQTDVSTKSLQEGADWRAAHEEAQKNVALLESQVGCLENELMIRDTRIKEEVSSWKDKFGLLEQQSRLELTALEEKIQSLLESLEHAKTKASEDEETHRTIMKTKDLEIEGYKSECDTSHSRIALLEAELSTTSTSLRELMAGSTESENLLRSNVKDLQEEVNILVQKEEASLAKILSLESQVNESMLQFETVSLQSKASLDKMSVESLTRKEDLNRLQSDLLTKDEAISKLNKVIEELQTARWTVAESVFETKESEDASQIKQEDSISHNSSSVLTGLHVDLIRLRNSLAATLKVQEVDALPVTREETKKSKGKNTKLSKKATANDASNCDPSLTVDSIHETTLLLSAVVTKIDEFFKASKEATIQCEDECLAPTLNCNTGEGDTLTLSGEAIDDMKGLNKAMEDLREELELLKGKLSEAQHLNIMLQSNLTTSIENAEAIEVKAQLEIKECQDTLSRLIEEFRAKEQEMALEVENNNQRQQQFDRDREESLRLMNEVDLLLKHERESKKQLETQLLLTSAAHEDRKQVEQAAASDKEAQQKKHAKLLEERDALKNDFVDRENAFLITCDKQEAALKEMENQNQLLNAELVEVTSIRDRLLSEAVEKEKSLLEAKGRLVDAQSSLQDYTQKQAVRTCEKETSLRNLQQHSDSLQEQLEVLKRQHAERESQMQSEVLLLLQRLEASQQESEQRNKQFADLNEQLSDLMSQRQGLQQEADRELLKVREASSVEIDRLTRESEELSRAVDVLTSALSEREAAAISSGQEVLALKANADIDATTICMLRAQSKEFAEELEELKKRVDEHARSQQEGKERGQREQEEQLTRATAAAVAVAEMQQQLAQEKVNSEAKVEAVAEKLKRLKMLLAKTKNALSEREVEIAAMQQERGRCKRFGCSVMVSVPEHDHPTAPIRTWCLLFDGDSSKGGSRPGSGSGSELGLRWETKETVRKWLEEGSVLLGTIPEETLQELWQRSTQKRFMEQEEKVASLQKDLTELNEIFNSYKSRAQLALKRMGQDDRSDRQLASQLDVLQARVSEAEEQRDAAFSRIQELQTQLAESNKSLGECQSTSMELHAEIVRQQAILTSFHHVDIASVKNSDTNTNLGTNISTYQPDPSHNTVHHADHDSTTATSHIDSGNNKFAKRDEIVDPVVQVVTAPLQLKPSPPSSTMKDELNFNRSHDSNSEYSDLLSVLSGGADETVTRTKSPRASAAASAPSSSSSSTALRYGATGKTMLLQQAEKELNQAMKELREQNSQLHVEILDFKRCLALADEQGLTLKDNIRDLEAALVREREFNAEHRQINVEYLVNVLRKFLMTSDLSERSKLAIVLCSMLHLRPEEAKAIEERWTVRRGGLAGWWNGNSSNNNGSGNGSTGNNNGNIADGSTNRAPDRNVGAVVEAMIADR